MFFRLMMKKLVWNTVVCATHFPDYTHTTLWSEAECQRATLILGRVCRYSDHKGVSKTVLYISLKTRKLWRAVIANIHPETTELVNHIKTNPEKQIRVCSHLVWLHSALTDNFFIQSTDFLKLRMMFWTADLGIANHLEMLDL